MGIFFGVVTDALVIEVNKLVIPPDVEEGFDVVLHP